MHDLNRFAPKEKHGFFGMSHRPIECMWNFPLSNQREAVTECEQQTVAIPRRDAPERTRYAEKYKWKNTTHCARRLMLGVQFRIFSQSMEPDLNAFLPLSSFIGPQHTFGGVLVLGA